MKKLIGLIALLISISFSANASQIKGIIITKKDTLHVMFIIPFSGVNYASMQYGVKYIDSAQVKHKLSPADAKEIRFEHLGDTVRMLSRFNNLSYNSDGSTKIFLKLLIDGPIKLFDYYIKNTGVYAPSGPGPVQGAPVMTSYTSNRYVLQKGIGDLVLYSKMNFKNEMPVFLKKCPDLVKLIQDKVYQKSDIERIVTYYNTNCGSN